MRYDTGFNIRYETDQPVPIADIIASLQGVEIALKEAAAFLPRVLPGIQVEHIDVRVREIAQASPLREMFLVAMIVAFQKDLETEVPNAIASFIGLTVPDSFDTLVTVVVLTIMFYGVGAIKTMVFGSPDGPARPQLGKLITELSCLTGISEEKLRQRLDDRYGEKKPWKRLKEAVQLVFQPSKRQSSVPVQINDRLIEREVVRDIPVDWEIAKAEENEPFRSFEDVLLDIHAQDKDHAGKGWAALIANIADRRVPLKLMTGVSAADLWGRDSVRGDVTVLYGRVADGMVPKAIHLHRLSDATASAADD
jgi:hypothetical protein